MVVKDIFALRKQGKVEEAYEAIRPIYREHKGRFTTLCMFWVASDVFKLRLEQGRVEEAEKIYKAMLRILPSVEEDEKHSAAKFMHYAEGRLIKASEKFRKRYFAIKKRKGRDLSTPPLAPPLIGAGNTEEREPDLVGAGSNEGINNPSDNPSEEPIIPLEPLNVIPSNAEESLEISPCATLSRDDSVLSKGQQSVLACIKAHPGLKVPGIEAETGIPAKSIERHIKVLIERRLIEHRGSKKTGGYHALNSTFGRLLP